MQQINVMATILALCCLSAGDPASRANVDDNDEKRRTIRVAGQGKSSAVPDMATIQTGVVTQSESANEALQSNSSAVEKMMVKLKELEISDKDMQTSQFSIQPVYERGPHGQQKPNVIGYRVSNQLRVRVRDLSKLGALLDQLVLTGSNKISGISFGVDDSKKVINEARVEAIKDAITRAELYAKAAGVAVGKVLTIDEGQMAIPRPMMYSALMEARSMDVPIATGEQDFSASVTVTFELNDE